MLSTIKSRFVAYFGLFTLINASLMVGLSFILLFTVEDEFIYRELNKEAVYLEQGYIKTKQYPKTREAHFSLYYSIQDLPQSIQDALSLNPQETEVFGESGKHYHLTYLAQESAILVSEVSAFLVVRKLTGPTLILMGVFTLIMMVIGGLLAYIFAHRTLKPLTELNTLLKQCKPNDLPKGFAKPFKSNEIGMLAGSLEQALLEISQYVEREVQFTRDASHELRTPITSIKGACELFEYDTTLTPQQRTVFARIKHAAENMQSTIESLLILARGESDLAADSVLLGPIIEHSVLSHSALLTKKGLELVLDIEEGAAIYANPQSVQIIIENLIQNAVRYTLKGTISIHAQQGSFTVTDTGSGFDFEQAKQSGVKAKNSTGFGIGLSLVTRLCEVNNLKLEVESGETGSTVILKRQSII